MNRRIPSARARSAIRLQSAVPSPRPCQSSITVIAASALAGSPSLRTKRPTPTPSPVCESNAIRASWSCMVDLRQVAKLRLAELVDRGQEAHVARVVAEAIERLGDRGLVVGSDRAHEDLRVVAQPQLDRLARQVS